MVKYQGFREDAYLILFVFSGARLVFFLVILDSFSDQG